MESTDSILLPLTGHPAATKHRVTTSIHLATLATESVFNRTEHKY